VQPFNGATIAKDEASGRMTLRYRSARVIVALSREVTVKTFLCVLALTFGCNMSAAMAQTAAEREACMADFQKYCPGVQPGGGRVMECLSKHLEKLTPQCKTVVEAHMPK